jgi:hypothetical protein
MKTYFNPQDLERFLAYQDHLKQQEASQKGSSFLDSCKKVAWLPFRLGANMVKSATPNYFQFSLLTTGVGFGVNAIRDHGIKCIALTTFNGLIKEDDFDRRYHHYFANKSWQQMFSYDYAKELGTGIGRVLYRQAANGASSLFSSSHTPSSSPSLNTANTTAPSLLSSFGNILYDTTTGLANNVKDLVTDPLGYPEKHILNPFANSACAKTSMGVQITAWCIALYLVATATRFCLHTVADLKKEPLDEAEENEATDNTYLETSNSSLNDVETPSEVDEDSDIEEELNNEAVLSDKEVATLFTTLKRKNRARG